MGKRLSAARSARPARQVRHAQPGLWLLICKLAVNWCSEISLLGLGWPHYLVSSQYLSFTWDMTNSLRRRLLLGGEWGGWCCSFDAATGAIQSIPDKFLSETAIAYGQIPVGFEELHSEAFEAIPYLNGSERATTDVAPAGEKPLRRRRVQTHPPVGCGGDSLPGDTTRCLLPTPRAGSFKLHVENETAPEALAAHAWSLDAPVPDRPGIVRLETVLRGHGGVLPTSNLNAFPSLGERTRVALLFSPATGELAAEKAHPSSPVRQPRPVVELWQERCWSDTLSLEVMETSFGPLHLDAVDKSQRVGIGCFGAVRSAAAASAPPSTTESTATWRDGGLSARGITEEHSAWRLSLVGGVELGGSPGLLEVALTPADGSGKRITLRRSWSISGAVGEAEVVVC